PWRGRGAWRSVHEHRLEGGGHLVDRGGDLLAVDDLHQEDAFRGADDDFVGEGVVGGLGLDRRLDEVAPPLRVGRGGGDAAREDGAAGGRHVFLVALQDLLPGGFYRVGAL